MTQSITIRRAVQALAALTFLCGAPRCLATVINFDNLSGPVALTNQYASQGAMFSEIEATNQFATSVVTVSAPNYATPFYLNTDPGSIWFVDPADASIDAYVTSVTITLNGYNNVGGWFDGATIEAFDITNSAIAGQTQTISPTATANYGSSTITLTGQIHKLEFINIENQNRLGIFPFDDLTYGTETDFPEPSTGMLMGSIAVLTAAGLALRGTTCRP